MTGASPFAGFHVAPTASLDDGERCWDRAQLEQAIAGLSSVQGYVDEIARLLRTMEQKLRAESPGLGR